MTTQRECCNYCMWYGPINKDGNMRKHRPATLDNKWGQPNKVQDMTADPCPGSNKPHATFGYETTPADLEPLMNPDDIPTSITKLVYTSPPVDKNHNGTPLYLSQNQTAELLAHFWPAIEAHIREQVAPTVVWRAERDGVPIGTYSTAEAGRAHCEDDLQQSSVWVRLSDAKPTWLQVAEDSPCELWLRYPDGMEEQSPYLVVPTPVADSYDPAA